MNVGPVRTVLTLRLQTPQRSDSVKKPKIKLTSSTPKTSNGVNSPKDSTSKTLKVKAKPKKAETPKEPELSPEEKKERKQVRACKLLYWSASS